MLSLVKLVELLQSIGILPIKYYILDNLLFYIEALSVTNGFSFFIYIPSKYEFAVPKEYNPYKIQYISLEDSENVAEEYAEAKENEEAYKGQIAVSPDNDKMEEQLENSYRKPLSLSDISSSDVKAIRSIYRQVRRLRYCVEDIPYKIGIQIKNYLAVVRRDDTLDCFLIKHYPRIESKRLIIISDLELVYNKKEKILADLEIVNKGIFDILEKNQTLHRRVLKKLFENREAILSYSEQSLERKLKLESQINKLNSYLEILDKAQRKILEELELLNSEKTYADTNIVYRRNNMESELEKIGKLKEDIMATLGLLKEKIDNLLLSVDNIMFDNSVMFDSMIQNFINLKKLV